MTEQILSARYTNPEYDTVLVLLQNEAGEVYEEYVEVDELEYSRYKQLGFTKEQLEEGTAEWRREYARESREAVKRFAKEEYGNRTKTYAAKLKKDSMALWVQAKLAEERLDKLNGLIMERGKNIDQRVLPAYLNQLTNFIEVYNEDKLAVETLAKQLEVEYTGQTVVELLSTIK